MPFTPVHMGPGILIKAVLQSSFSLMVFGWSQIVMDVQPLIVMLTGEGHLHGFSHTYIGATLLAILAGLSGKFLSELGLKILILSHRENPIVIRWKVVFISALIGTYSHVFLDSMMHSDVMPFYPFLNANVFLSWLTIDQLHKLCLYSGLFGAGLYYGLHWYFMKKPKHKKST